MATVTRFPIHQLPTDELEIQLWELVMAGERGSDAFVRIDAEIRRRNSSQYALRLATVESSTLAPKPKIPPMSFTTKLVTRLN
jgi:hypothetical protein